MEIWNPGNFPEGYKPLDFVKKELPSILRNPLIANILYLSEDVEKWGSGLRRIHEECKEQGVKVKFEVLKYGFSVVFYRPESDANLKQIEQNVDIKTKIDSAQIRRKSGANPAQIRQEWIIQYLNKYKEIRNSTIAKKFLINRDTARTDLNNLIKQGKIIKKGAGNNVWYELKE